MLWRRVVGSLITETWVLIPSRVYATVVVFKLKVVEPVEGTLEEAAATVVALTERVKVSVSRYHCTTREAIEAPKMAAARTMLAQFLDL